MGSEVAGDGEGFREGEYQTTSTHRLAPAFDAVRREAARDAQAAYEAGYEAGFQAGAASRSDTAVQPS